MTNRLRLACLLLAAASTRALGSGPDYGKLPLVFEANAGQTDSRVKFLAQGAGYRLFLTPQEAVFLFAPGESGDASVVRLTLVGARAGAKSVGVDAGPGKANYFLGNDPKKWRTDVPTYRAVRFENVWRGIDLLYYGKGRQLEYDFVVRPGADPDAIRMSLPDAARLSTDEGGDLVVDTPRGTMSLKRPVVYQEIAGRRVEIPGRYVLRAENRVAFRVAAYDHRRPLVIDPVLNYATFLGGTGVEAAFGIAVDSAGSAYVTGRTFAADFPVVGGLPPGSPGAPDVFVTKLSPAGNAFVYSTYLGGSGDDRGYGIAVDAFGNAYVCGRTVSTDFPVTAGVLQSSNSGGSDAFVAKLSPAGNSLVYSTYLGGGTTDFAFAIAIDGSSNAYVTGQTDSADFPFAGASPFQTSIAGGIDAFVSKITPAGDALAYSTYLGGTGNDIGNGIAVDGSGNAYVVGQTDSATDFPTQGPYQAANAGGVDAFVTKVAPSGSTLVYSTYLGGSGDDIANAVAQNGGNAYVTGITTSTDFPPQGALQGSNAGGSDAFVTKLSVAGNTLSYSTYLGGSGDDSAFGIVVDGAGSATVVGATLSTDFVMANAFQPTSGGGNDAFVTKLSAAGNSRVFSTYLGGSLDDVANAVAQDSSGRIYVAGNTDSANFPVRSAAQPLQGGSTDVFIARVCGEAAPTATVSGGGAICPSASATIQAALTGVGPWDLVWSDGVLQTGVAASPATRSVSPAVTTVYTVTQVNDSLCYGVASGSATVTFKPFPTATLAGSGTICAGGPIPLTVALTGAAPWSLSWSDGFVQSGILTSPATRTVTPLVPTTYTLVAVTDAGSCPGIAFGSATITPGTPPTAFLSGGGPSCPGAPVVLSVALTGSQPWLVTWSDGFLQTATVSPAKRTVAPNISTTYFVSTVTDRVCSAVGGGRAVVTITIDASAAAITAPGSLCANGSGTASVPDSGPGATYSWTIFGGTITGGASSPTVSFSAGPTGPLVLNVAVTLGGCTIISSKSPTLIPGPALPVVSGPASAFTGDTGLVASVASHAGASYAWTIQNGVITSGTTSSAVTFSVGLPGVVTLTVVETSAFGCGSPPAVFTIPVGGATATKMIPIVLDVPGKNGARFASEMTLANPGPSTSGVSLTFTAADALGGTGSGTVTETLGPGRQLVVPDVLAYLRSKGLVRSGLVRTPLVASGGGTLRVAFGSLVPGGTAFAGARTTSPSGPGRAGFASSAPDVPGANLDRVAVYGLRQNTADRSNLALVNSGAGAAVTLRVTLFSGDPGDGRSMVLPFVTLAPGQWTQLNAVLDTAAFTNGWALVERLAGADSFIVYAVINDNVTNDGSFVPSVPADRFGGNQVLPSIVETGAFSSELVVTNPSAKSTKLTLVFTESLANPAGLSTGTIVDTLLPGEQRIIPNAVDFLRSRGAAVGAKGAAAYGGSLLVQLSQSGFPVDGFAGARTATPAPGGGQYGLFLNAVTIPEAASSGAFIFGLQQNATTRSNLALLNASVNEGPVTLQYEVWDGDTGAKAGTSDPVVLTPGQWLQINGVLSTFGVTNGWVRIVRLSGSAPWAAYGVLNDGATPGAGTGDGSYVGMTLFP